MHTHTRRLGLHACKYTCMQTYMRKHVDLAYIYVNLYTDTCKLKYTCMETYMRRHADSAYIYVNIYTYTKCRQSPWCVLASKAADHVSEQALLHCPSTRVHIVVHRARGFKLNSAAQKPRLERTVPVEKLLQNAVFMEGLVNVRAS